MSEFKHIVRIGGRDLDGRKKVAAALSDIRGVGYNMAHSILNLLKIDSRLRLGMLNDAQIAELENTLKELSRIKIPEWAMNRRKDLDTGSNLHLIGSELELAVKADIDREKAVGSWRGVRHSLGLKVRGQRTRTTGRRRGATVGVRKPGRSS